MANFSSAINTSLRGRELGIQRLTTSECGGRLPAHFLAGTVIGIRGEVTSAETTSANLLAYGFSQLSTGSSAVHTLDPPIKGVAKTIFSSGASTNFVKTANSETIETSAGSTFTTVRFVGPGTLSLIGVTTARYAVVGTAPTNCTFSTST